MSSFYIVPISQLTLKLRYISIFHLVTKIRKRVIKDKCELINNNSITEITNVIFSYSKPFRPSSIDALNEDLNISEEEWILNYDDISDKGIDYIIYLSIIKTVIFCKENYERYSLFDKDSFFNAYSLCGGVV